TLYPLYLDPQSRDSVLVEDPFLQQVEENRIQPDSQAGKPQRGTTWSDCGFVVVYRWFHGPISRAEAETLLTLCREGSYLVRSSEASRGEYSLSLR
uniref:SH2 domain-containing protein n=1 Tax=Pseudonaja textilis TaxID=8673 RepID=A0A670YV44_PSETE